MDKQTFTQKAKIGQFVEQYARAHETDAIQQLRTQGLAQGFKQSSASQNHMLRVLVSMLRAQSIILVGTGSLIETAQLVEGLRNTGKLTVVDSSERGVATIRSYFSSITDQTNTQLRAVRADIATYFSRLNPNEYDLIVVCGDAGNYSPTFEESTRILTETGSIIFTDITASANAPTGGIMDAADRSDKAVAMRSLLEQVEQDDRFDTSFIEVGTGVLLATRVS